ncbi:MAG: thimet oligopeptidase [Pseudomonadales bacterium]|jgi:thimet oligopeptidase
MRKLALAFTSSVCIVSCQPSLESAQETKLTPYTTPNHYYFDKSLTAEQLTINCQQNLDGAKSDLARLEQSSAPYTAETLLTPLNELFIELDNATGLTYLLNSVHPDKAVQTAADQCIKDFSKLSTNLGLSKPLYSRIKQVDTTDDDLETQRFHNHLIRDFKRSGVDQDDNTRERIREINETLTSLGQEFSKNIREDVRSIELTSTKQLDGLPEDYIAAHTSSEQDKITITTDYPDFFPFVRYAHDDDAKKAIYTQFLNRAYPKNDQVLKQIIATRHDYAQTLGYKDYATYATEVLMVKNPQVVADFIERISSMAEPRAQADYSQLLSTLKTIDSSATSVQNWQKAYIEEKVRRDDFEVDTKEIRQYFEYNKVKHGIFQLIEDLFQVQIKPWQTDVWDDSVEAFEIWEGESIIGRFYLDMHPRDDKFKHAAQFGLQPGIDGQQLPVAALVCNFPGGDDNSLMEHRQVETFLHEFGHLIHSIFGGKQRWVSFAGTATERDFVEAPSQMLEEWIWDYDSISTFAINKNGEVIPRELVEKMRKARDFNRGTHIKNQMFYAALSLNYYQTLPDELNLKQKMIELQNQYSPFAYIDDTHFYASFGHLYGYSAAYYTYMWSEVIAADILSEFKKQGMRNTELANHYRQTVLAPGGSKDAKDLVTDFLGRPSNFDAFIERLNQ